MERDLFGVGGMLHHYASTGNDRRIRAAALFLAAAWRVSPQFAMTIVLMPPTVLLVFAVFVFFLTAPLFN